MSLSAFRFLVVPDAFKAVARELVLTIAPDGAQAMFTVGLSPTGTAPATHWISTGLIETQFAALLGDAATTFGAYQQSGGTTVTLTQVQALYAAATIRDDVQGQELATLDAMGLKPVQAPI